MSASTAAPKPLVNLYSDSDLPNYSEEIAGVEPKSFRNRIINVLIWTTFLPLILLVFFQQKNFETATEVQNNLQLGLAREAALHIESGVANLKSQLSLALATMSSSSPPGSRDAALENLMRQNPEVERLVYSDAGYELTMSNPTAAVQGELTIREFVVDVSQQTEGARSERSLSAHVNASSAARTLNDLLFRQPYCAAVFDKDERLVYSTAGGAVHRCAASDPLKPAELDQIKAAGGAASLLRTPGDRLSSHIKVFIPISSLDWTVVISQPQSVRDLALRDTALIWAAGFFVALAGTLLLATFVSIPITRSFNSLMQSIEDYSKTGVFKRRTEKLALEGSTEFIKLEETFERMIQTVEKSKAALQQANVRLEDEVKARTSDLLLRNEELNTLQTLLAPFFSSDDFEHETSTVAHCVERFRILLDLPSLVFTTDLTGPVPPNSLDVRLGTTIYGRLILPRSTLLTEDKRNSLERLAYALAIVTANARLVSHLAREQVALQTVFESMTDGVVIIGRSGKIRYANEYAARLLNDGESILKLNFARLMTRDWEGTTGSRVADDLKDGVKTRVRSVKDGMTNRVLELFPFTVSGMPGLAGERPGWILRDVTQEASLEAVKENIAGVVAHELKTPLTLLQLQARNLSRTIEKGAMPEVEDARDIAAETLQLGQLVDDLLDVSRIRAGAMKLNLRVMHVATLIDRAEKLAGARYPICITRSIDMDAELFCVDADRMTQVFVNLFNNAARYKKPEQKAALITVSTRSESGSIFIDVADQGTGIAPSKVKHIFDQFYQADMTASRSHGGSGLGLTIVRGIIHAHGGTISVKTGGAAGGTTFTLKLPLRTPPELL